MNPNTKRIRQILYGVGCLVALPVLLIAIAVGFRLLLGIAGLIAETVEKWIGI